MGSTNLILRHLIDRDRLDTILKHPDVCARNTWELFIVFFWERLKSECYQMMYEDEDPELVPDYKEFTIEGVTIEKDILDTMLESSAEDFMEAMKGRMTISIEDRPYRVPSNDDVTLKRLTKDMFMFPYVEAQGDPDAVKILKECVYVFEHKEERSTQEDKQEARKMFHRIVWLVEVDDGWDRLTDMEAAAFEWSYRMYKYEGRFVKDIPIEVNKAFVKIEKSVGFDNAYCITDCWISDFRSAQVQIDTQFSARKIRDWNERNRQKSIVDTVDQDTADAYWYEECNTFRL